VRACERCTTEEGVEPWPVLPQVRLCEECRDVLRRALNRDDYIGGHLP